ncbi:sugar transferase [Elioraea thermophila]|uniref:sugar transferase n=1 Tax=Elioraea thermophila TaxID=2185104 RepID=UPI000DF35A7A|nr:sugar transferase [Elioraea thermophila]
MLSAEIRQVLPVEQPAVAVEPAGLPLTQTAAHTLPLPANDLAATRRPGPIARAVKRAIDIAGAAALLVVFAPVMLIIALLVARDGGPVLYGHTRVGRGGVPFRCLKFRSMVVDADARLAALLERDPLARAEWEATRKLRRDPRVTAIGRFLRATSLDELPQLFNVLAGDMSLVGPRPVQQSELAQFYGTAAAHYRAVRPGLTGPWQISGRSDTTYAERVAFDVAYVERFSLLTDLAILLRTPFAVLARKGAY